MTEVEAFLQIWQMLTGESYRQVMSMRIHQLTQVEPVATAEGHLRLATEADRPLLLDWFKAFSAEVGEIVSETPERMVDSGLKRQSIHLWEDGVPVSWASGSRSLPVAARIGPVYTPPEYRRKGYATACVAALSQKFWTKDAIVAFYLRIWPIPLLTTFISRLVIVLSAAGATIHLFHSWHETCGD